MRWARATAANRRAISNPAACGLAERENTHETRQVYFPPLTDEEKAKYGDRPVVNNGRARQLYLPAELRGGDFAREADPAMSLDAAFKTMFFWIVSRVNNCHY